MTPQRRSNPPVSTGRGLGYGLGGSHKGNGSSEGIIKDGDSVFVMREVEK